MTNLMIAVSYISAGLLQNALCLLLISRLLPSRMPEKKGVLAALAGTAAFLILLSLAGLPDFYNAGLKALLLTFCAGRLLKANIRMSLFISIFYEIALSFWQFLFAAWLGVLLRCPVLPDDKTGTGQAALWLLHGLLAAAVFLLLRYKRPSGAREAFRFASGIALAGFLAVITLSEQSVLAITDDTLDMWTLLSVILMMSVLVFYISRQYEMEKELARLKSEQAGLLERDYAALNQAYAVNAKLFHDFHNHIGVLQQLLSRQKTKEAVEYLNALQEPVREMADNVWTGDETIDYLINSKANKAKSDGTDFRIQVEFPRHTNLRSADLCAILGNLLDNALEAARQVPEAEKRYIRLTIRRINQMIIIKVENSYASGHASPLIEKDGALKTTKEDSGLHGWGLKSARTAAEKYGGCVRTSYTDTDFQAVATLSYEGVPIP